jgi:hypothetical protein
MVALYRLYECTCVQDEISIVNEVMYIFYNNDWPLEDFPDPKDENKERYTVLAAIMAALVKGFNRRYDLLRLTRDISAPTYPTVPICDRPIVPHEKEPAWVSTVERSKRLIDLWPRRPFKVIVNKRKNKIVRRFNVALLDGCFTFVW